MTTNILIAGVGGQGTVLASKLLAAAAMNAGLDARTAETIGMAQRGGSVTSHVRMGGVIHSPLIPPGCAHMIIAFEPAEAVRAYPYLAENGVAVVCRDAVHPAASQYISAPDKSCGNVYDPSESLDFLRAHIKRLFEADRSSLVAPEHIKALNVALLGVASETGVMPFDAPELETVLRERLSPKHLDMNLAALAAGRALAIKKAL